MPINKNCIAFALVWLCGGRPMISSDRITKKGVTLIPCQKTRIIKFVYNYQSTKPFKTLPEFQTTRVYDKTPVRALAQEISGNRVIYGNYIDKHTPPAAIDYNVACTEKAEFSINEISVSSFQSYSNTNIIIVDVTNAKDRDFIVSGMIFTSDSIGAIIPDDTFISNVVLGPAGNQVTITLTNNVTISTGDIIILQPGGDVQNFTSRIEYPNHSVKTNRNYQVGFVLSDRYGRQSSVILSNNTEELTINNITYAATPELEFSEIIGQTATDRILPRMNSLLIPEQAEEEPATATVEH